MSENLDASPKSRGKALLFVILLGGLGDTDFMLIKLEQDCYISY